MHTEWFLILIGGVILLGFLSRALFERIGIPDVLILIAAGAVLGLSISPEARSFIYQFAPYFGTLALIMILFEGGLDIDPQSAISQLRPALLLSFLSFALSAAAVAGILFFGFGWGRMASLLMGAALGCTSSAIVIPVVKRVSMPEGTRTLLDLEAAFSDTFAIVALFALLEFARTGLASVLRGFLHLAGSFGIAGVVSVFVSVLWVLVLEYTKRRPISYLLTFAVLMLLYAGVERLGGSGAIAVLIFGILVTEAKRFPDRIFFWKRPREWLWVREEAHETLQWFHQELTFMVRTFFFVYIGLLFESHVLTPTVARISFLLSAAIFAGRLASVGLLGPALPDRSQWLANLFIPRGLVTAVLAGLPVLHHVPGTDHFLDYAVPVIILTNVFMAAGLVVRAFGGMGTRG